MASEAAGRFLRLLLAIVLTVAAIHFGQPFLMPLAMALLLTFLLRPVIISLERRGLARVPAVMMVILLIVVVLSAATWVVGTQLTDLATNLPSYRTQLKQKLGALKGSNGFFKNIRDVVSEVDSRLAPPVEEELIELSDKVKGPRKGIAVKPDGEPQLVRIVPDPPSPMTTLTMILGSVGAMAATAAVVIVLVVFMLLEYEELRSRLVRLAGTGKMTVTTKTLDEAGKRISRYLLMNAIVNGGFGLVVGIGLALIGVHYALLWGFLAAVLRFLPYVGPIVASVLPVGVSILQGPGWTTPALAIGLFIVLELITNNVIEPMVYGRSAGVSTVALLVSATFWTWAWGPIGLLLSVPMTVVLAVLGKYIPQLEAFGVMLGDAPALPQYMTFYQRLLAGDQDEASEILDDAFTSDSRLGVYDALVIPALALAERDHKAGELTLEERDAVWHSTREMVEESTLAMQAAEAVQGKVRENGEAEAATSRIYLVGCPAHDVTDELALTMLGQVLPAHVELKVAPLSSLVSEVVAMLSERVPDAVLISSLGPGGVGQIRHLCKRIQQNHPGLRLYVGRWGYLGDRDRMTAGLKTRGATQVVTTLTEALDAISRIQPLAPIAAPTPARPVEAAALPATPARPA